MYGCKTLCVQEISQQSKVTRSANKFATRNVFNFRIFRQFLFTAQMYLQHGGVVLCSVKWRHCVSHYALANSISYLEMNIT